MLWVYFRKIMKIKKKLVKQKNNNNNKILHLSFNLFLLFLFLTIIISSKQFYILPSTEPLFNELSLAFLHFFSYVFKNSTCIISSILCCFVLYLQSASIVYWIFYFFFIFWFRDNSEKKSLKNRFVGIHCILF